MPPEEGHKTSTQLGLVHLFCRVNLFIWFGNQFSWNRFIGELVLVRVGSLAGVSSFVLWGKRIYLIGEIGSSVQWCWHLCYFCWSSSASFVFRSYKVYKNGKYFICPEGKIFGVHIKYVKIRTMAAEWLTIKQSGGQKHFTKERNTHIE